MPRKPKTLCGNPRCQLRVDGPYCPKHTKPRDRSARGTTAERGYAGDWPKARATCLRLSPQCLACGNPATEVDHIVPISRGGTHCQDNLQSMCTGCHATKHARERKRSRTTARRSA
jgi:5-methylcytosine-specific restriction protein A